MERKGNYTKNRSFNKSRSSSTGGKGRSNSYKSRSFKMFANDESRAEDRPMGERRVRATENRERRGRSFSKAAPAPRKRNFDRDADSRRPQVEEPKKRRDITAESKILSEIVERRHREGRTTPQKQKIRSLEHEEQYSHIRLNKYIANAGVCSRREADALIVAGAITVNGQPVTELGYKVAPTDEVRFGDRVLQREKPVYLLLNKPKDYITTMYDEFNRKHVMQLVRGACKERIYPVGRLDRDTTGVLLFTNDGEMTKKLTHPRNGVRKIYHVTLNKNLKPADFQAILNGIELNDGPIVPDELSYVGNAKNEIGITIHSGRNRIVRRIFEALDYQVEKLDRVIFASLTKKDLPRGEWRFLTQEEINFLKMLS